MWLWVTKRRASKLTIKPTEFATLLLLIICTISPNSALAQSASPGLDPRQLERLDLPRQPPDRARRAPMQLPRFGAAATADSTPITTLRAVTVSGRHAISESAVARAYRPFIGQRVSQADLVKIAEEIGRLYREAGYYLSRAIVPAQDVQSGFVRIQVIEGVVAEIKVEATDAQRFGVPALLAGLSAETPAKISSLERKLALLNERAGLQVVDTSIDEVSPMSGAFRLVVKLKTWRLYASSSLDNLGSFAVGPWQTFNTLAFNSYGLPGDVLTANFSSTPQDPRELMLGRLSYDTPIGTDGFRIGGTALHSEVRPGDERRDYDVVTRTESVELRGGFAPIESRRTSLILTAALAATDSRQDDIFGLFYQDRIRTLNAVADFRLQDNLGGTNYLTLIGKQGLNALGATPYGDLWSSRYDADPSVSILNAWYTRYQTVTDTLSIKLAFAGQITNGPVLNWQQFYLGGLSFGRGYATGEISGDNGLGGSFELRFDGTTTWPLVERYQLYAFVEGGAVWNAGYAIGDGLQLGSAGAGIRLNLPGSLRADLGLAFPFAYRSPDNPANAVRFLLSLSNSFKLCPGSSLWACT
jgi:hemolysin activation/secretion protein